MASNPAWNRGQHATCLQNRSCAIRACSVKKMGYLMYVLTDDGEPASGYACDCRDLSRDGFSHILRFGRSRRYLE